MVAKGDQIWLGSLMATKGNQIWRGHALGSLRLCGSTIRPTLSSFYVFSYVMCEDFICFKQSMPYTWKKMAVVF
jgi:hypothetical protein